MPGQANDSYGIEVARLAGLPREVIINAQKILNNLDEQGEKDIDKIVSHKNQKKSSDKELKQVKTSGESNKEKERKKDKEKIDKENKKDLEMVSEDIKIEYNQEKNKKEKKEDNTVKQLPLFNPADPILKEIEEKEIVNMTPLEAINFLYEVKQKLKEKRESHG